MRAVTVVQVLQDFEAPPTIAPRPSTTVVNPHIDHSLGSKETHIQSHNHNTELHTAKACRVLASLHFTKQKACRLLTIDMTQKNQLCMIRFQRQTTFLLEYLVFLLIHKQFYFGLLLLLFEQISESLLVLLVKKNC